MKSKHYIRLLFAFTALFPALGGNAQTTYTYVGAPFEGNWNDSSAWMPNGIPGAIDTAVLAIQPGNNAGLFINENVTVAALFVRTYHELFGSGGITVIDSLRISYPGNCYVDLTLVDGANGVVNDNDYPFPSLGSSNTFSQTLTVNGEITFSGDAALILQAQINGKAALVRGDLYGDLSVNASGLLSIDVPNQTVNLGRITNNGTVHWKNGNIKTTGTSFRNNNLLTITATNDTLSADDLAPDSVLLNNGVISLGSNADNIAILKRVRNNGDIILAGPTRLGLMALDHRGTVTGPSGATLELSGYYFGNENVFSTGASVQLGELVVQPFSSLIVEAGVTFTGVERFTFGASGPASFASVLPSNASYLFQNSSSMLVDQVFNGPVSFSSNGSLYVEGGVTFNDVTDVDGFAFYGTGALTFTDSVRLVFASFDATTPITVSPTGVATLRQVYLGDLKNDGEVFVAPGAELFVSPPGVVNNGSWTTTATTNTAYALNSIDFLFRNNGTFSANAQTTNLYTGMINSGVITVAPNAELALGLGMEHSGTISGDAATSALRLVFGNPGTPFTFLPTSTIEGFDELISQQSNVKLQEGATFASITHAVFENGNIDIDLELPSDFRYYFRNANVRLNTLFQPTQNLEVLDANFEGSGSVRISDNLDWMGGTFDVPLRIKEGATASIRENQQRPVVSSPFVNEGDITLSGGIFEINTGFFKNTGNWNVVSGEDVIIDGFTPFDNAGIFAICGNQPIEIAFNVPFINGSSGTFQGEGSYLFNASFSNFGTVTPGCSPGTLTIEDDFDSAAGVTIEVEGGLPGQYDKLVVNGDMTASGVLRVVVPDGVSLNGAIKVIQTTGAFSGTFSEVIKPGNYTVQYESDGVSLLSDGTVSIESPSLAETWALTPTLATDVVRITATQNLTTDAQVSFVDAQGRTVRILNFGTGDKTLEIGVSDLPAGLYRAIVQTPESFWHTPFVTVR